MRRSYPALFALVSTAVIAACASTPQPVSSPGEPALVVVSPSEPREQTADQQVQHVLNRLAFGPRPGDVGRVREVGVDRWIAMQLAPERMADSVTTRVLASYEMLGKSNTDLVAMYEEGQKALRQMQKEQARQGDSSGKRDLRAEVLRDNPDLRDRLRQNQRILGDLQSAKLARAVVSDRQLEEVMVDFWENHFSTTTTKSPTAFSMVEYSRDALRPHALGRFRDILGAVAKSPAMLFYLDQWQSAADSMHPTLVAQRPLRRATAARAANAGGPPPLAQRRGLNENYARELMELHTLGVDGGYTQQDVIEVARALTGWTMMPRQRGEFVFVPQIHDAGQKVVLGHTLAAGRGIQDGEEVLDLLAKHPNTARYIARKLATRFVSDEPPAALVDRAAQTFLRTDGNIREVVRTIVTSPEFFSRTAYRAKVKSPFELVASALRAVGAQADTSMRSVQLVAFLGQPVFGHQAPNGWPEKGEEWMNSGAILNRINFGLGLASGRFPGAALNRWPEFPTLRGAPREQQVDGVIQAFLGGHASPDTRQILLNGENPLAAKLAASVKPDSGADSLAAMTPMRDASMNEPMRNRPNAVAKNGQTRPALARQIGGPQQVQLQGLAQVVGLAIGAPEFQRR